MSLLHRLSGSLARSLRLSSQQFAANKHGAAIHMSATLDARRKEEDSDGSDNEEEDTEQQNPKQQQQQQQQQEEVDQGDDDLLPRFDASFVRSKDGKPAAPLSELVLNPSNSRFDVATLVSPALAAALEEAAEGEDALEQATKAFATLVEKVDRGEKIPDDELASDEDLLAVAEAIDLYFLAAPEADADADGFEEIDRDTLEAMGDMIKEVLGGGARNTTINAAPPGRLPWEVLDVDEAEPYVNWGADLTEGKARDPWKNAQLSSAAKERMWELHSQHGWTAEQLAQHFKIRVQRAAAIVALKEREHAARARGETLHTELQEAMDELQGAHEVMGSSEQHHVVLPSFPNYRELTEEDADKLATFLERRLGKKFDDIQLEDMTEEVTQELLAAAGMDQGAVEAELAQREEEHLVAEFRRNLEFNLGKTGTTLSRQSRKTHPPKRPDAGWSLLVQPLGKAARSGKRAAYVAQPDGTRRELTPDEQLNLERQQPRPRHKVL